MGEKAQARWKVYSKNEAERNSGIPDAKASIAGGGGRWGASLLSDAVILARARTAGRLPPVGGAETTGAAGRCGAIRRFRHALVPEIKCD